MHLNLKDSITAAGFASSALDIETESTLLVSACLCIRCRRKQIPDHVKHTGVSCRIGTRRTTDRRLIDVNDLVQLFQTKDVIMLSRNATRTV